MMKKNSWKLNNAEELAKKYPKTFYIPGKSEISMLKKGDFVKLIFGSNLSSENSPPAERMWVLITEVNEKGFIGKLSNLPMFIYDLEFDDLINFEAKHIIEIK